MKAIAILRKCRFLLGALLVAGACAAQADIAVVVHPSNNNTLEKTQIKRMYLGQLKVFPDNSRVKPIDQEEGSLIREMFASSVLGKSSQQLKTYWAKLMFTGQGNPPVVEKSDRDVKQAVADDPSAIGYIDAANLDDTVKVIYRF